MLNAKSFEAQGFSIVIDEDDLSDSLLVEKIRELYCSRHIYMEAMERSNQLNSIDTIIKLIQDTTPDDEETE